jgi:hypothetical protein
MPRMPSDLPLRPMPLGELLDAAVSLLRRRPVPLLGAAAVLAVAEQALLAPLRAAAGLAPPYYLSGTGGFGAWWRLTAVGFAAEAAIITLLGAPAAAAAVPALLGTEIGHRWLWRRARPLATLVAAVVLGALCGAAAFVGLAWPLLYGLAGLVAPVLVVERAGGPVRALGRSARLAARSGLRGCRIRLVGYLTWFAIRFALGAGWVEAARLVTGEARWVAWLSPLAWALADTVAYAALACLDAVLLLDIRVRTEGLDIVLARARSRGEDPAGALVRAP